MFGAAFTYLIAQVKSFIERQALIYGLMAVGVLFFVFAAGYGLDAIRAMLMIRMGGIYASVIVGVGLLIGALACLGLAKYLRRASVPDVMSEASSSLPDLPSLPRVTGSAILVGGAVTGLVAAILLAAKRSGRHVERLSDHVNDAPVYRAPRS